VAESQVNSSILRHLPLISGPGFLDDQQHKYLLIDGF